MKQIEEYSKNIRKHKTNQKNASTDNNNRPFRHANETLPRMIRLLNLLRRDIGFVWIF